LWIARVPLSVRTHAANHHAVTLVQLSFDFYLDDDRKQNGVNLIAPHRSTRKLKTQDGRRLRRYERRWLVERFFAGLPWKRRVLIRWEYDASNFLGFVQLACITMLLKQF
jgi:transposase